MKKYMFIAAALAAVLVGFSACSNGSSDNNTPTIPGGGSGTPEVPLLPGNYTVESDLSCVAPGMNNADLAKGVPVSGYKPLLESTRATVDSDGNITLTLKFRKARIHFNASAAAINTFIDPRNSPPGYYDMAGVKQNALSTTVSTDDTAKDPTNQDVYYLTSMTFPASKGKSEYFLWIYINSGFMGAQFSDGKGTAGHSQPNQHSKYAGKFTVDWTTLTKE
ncbi:hypothetical protein HRQ91_04610 [Treponema parvum]|uniref:Lipoprotein n=1 Tax=Treponema parvum TaxID=138851 RepID=A0A975F3B7_9SPIR|nr:hypothetical protein [Treponema parvum]QTQ13796.1 hypothetical protein HRQ91_04610 [Treponema parvum]